MQADADAAGGVDPEQVKIGRTISKAAAAAPSLHRRGEEEERDSRELLIQQNIERVKAAVVPWFLVLRPQKEKVEILLDAVEILRRKEKEQNRTQKRGRKVRARE